MLDNLDVETVGTAIAAGGTATLVGRLLVSMAINDFNEFKKKTAEDIEEMKKTHHLLDKRVDKIEMRQEYDQRRNQVPPQS